MRRKYWPEGDSERQYVIEMEGKTWVSNIEGMGRKFKRCFRSTRPCRRERWNRLNCGEGWGPFILKVRESQKMLTKSWRFGSRHIVIFPSWVPQQWTIPNDVHIKKAHEAVPVLEQWKWIPVGTMNFQVWSLASFSGLRIWHCHELSCRLQTWLGSGVAVAVALAIAVAPIWPLAWEFP